ncbi:MAG TPA: DMT family transporter [Acetobacteraceae bacterium]|jgi:S-adenosylmethionine uptake transporter|nr:DMT family transporter [Acetobacteraceae bacterium]
MQPVSTTDHARPAVPFAVATGGILLFTTVDAIVKSLPHGVPVIEVVAMCFIFAIPVALVAVWCMGADWPTLASWKANVPRGVLRTGSTVLFFVALRRLPFAEVLTLGYLAPLMVALMAAFVLGERLRAGVLGAVSLGLCGVGVIAWSSLTNQQALSGDLVGIAAAFGSAVTYAANNVMLRSQAQRDSAASIVLIQQIVPVIVAMPMAAATWATPTLPVWFAFALFGGVNVGGHFLLTWAYRRAQAGVLASADYLALPYAAVLGFFLFDEEPTQAVWIGAALIIGACLIVTRLRN